MYMNLTIRRALPNDGPVLTQIAFESKGYWEYPEEYMKVWRDELTIKGEYIDKNIVYAAVINGAAAGFYSLVNNQTDLLAGSLEISRGYWLDHLFVHPQFIGKGIGASMFRHAGKLCRKIGCGSLKILADPNAAGFYIKMGATYLEEYPSNIPGRTIPMFVFYVE